MSENASDFCSMLEWVSGLTAEKIKKMRLQCLKTASDFSNEKCADRALSIYKDLTRTLNFTRRQSDDSAWSQTARLIHAHWDVVKNLTNATTKALLNPLEPENKQKQTSAEAEPLMAPLV